MTTTTTTTTMPSETDSEFPCALTIDIPLPDHRLASTAMRALQVDAELSPLVRRTFRLVSSNTSTSTSVSDNTDAGPPSTADVAEDESDLNVLRTEYHATTNRMLRVAVNGFMESLGVVLEVMQELDVDVLTAQTQVQT